MAGRGKRKGGADNGFEDWGGYMAAKISKLENQFSEEGNEGGKISNIFNSIAIFVNGYTTPTAEELKRIMIDNGGTYHHYYNSNTTTHIIASNLCDAKISKLKGGEKFVKPSWIVDSLKAGTLLDFKSYMLYTGSSVKGQQTLQFTVEKKESNSESNEKHHYRAGEANFLSEFYNRSRLHHISTMGAEFKRYVSELREKGNSTPGIEHLMKWKDDNRKEDYHNEETVFMHIDMDCFFVSVGLRNHPWLRGKPVVVAHAKADARRPPHRQGSNLQSEFNNYKDRWLKKSKFASSSKDDLDEDVSDVFARLEDIDESCSMSEIACCSYEARAAGLYNGMFMGAALKLCPTLKTIPYDFEGYKQVSYTLYDTVSSYTLDIEAVSCDELYADITCLLRQVSVSPEQFATHLREVIFNKTQCCASIGMGPNMLMARLSTKKAKPDGLFYIQKAQTVDFMKDHEVKALPGVGKSMAHRLHAMGLRTCDEMQQITLGKLQNEFGVKQGQTLYHMCRGEDKREVKSDHIRKSISADVNYGIRFANEQEMYKFTQELSGEVSKRMQDINVRGRSLTLKLKVRAKDAPVESAKFMGHGYCDSLSRSITLSVATRDANVIHRQVLALLRPLKVDCCEMRGIGIQLSKLIVDNVKGKSLAGSNSNNNTLLNFVSRANGEKLAEDIPQLPFAPIAESSSSSSSTKEEILNCLELPCATATATATTTATATATDDITTEDIGQLSIAPIGESQKKEEWLNCLELPSATQIDSSVFDELPDELKNDIRNEYQRQGVSISGITVLNTAADVVDVVSETPKNVPVSYDGIHQVSDIDSSYWLALPDEIKAEIQNEIHQKQSSSEIHAQPGPSNQKCPTIDDKTTNKKPTKISYEGIHQVTDIDSSYWDALPDDIKAEIQVDIQHTKDKDKAKHPETSNIQNSPSKMWSTIFKDKDKNKEKNMLKGKKTKRIESTKRSPLKRSPLKRSPLKLNRPTSLWENKKAVSVCTEEREAWENTEAEHSLSGATLLSDIRCLLKDWFSSTLAPEEEDRLEVSNYLVGLISTNNLDKVEPILRFLNRLSTGMNDCWKQTVKKIIDHIQLYVIQYYNAPLKLPSDPIV